VFSIQREVTELKTKIIKKKNYVRGEWGMSK